VRDYSETSAPKAKLRLSKGNTARTDARPMLISGAKRYLNSVTENACRYRVCHASDDDMLCISRPIVCLWLNTIAQDITAISPPNSLIWRQGGGRSIYT